MPYYPPASASDATKLPLAGGSMTGTITSAFGTITDPKSFLDLSATWNDAADTFYGLKLDVTKTAAAVGSFPVLFSVGGVSKFEIDADGNVRASGGINMGGVSNSVGTLFIGGNSVLSATASPLTLTINAAGYTNVNVSQGNFGIATAVPSEKLDVTGNAAFSGANGQIFKLKQLTELTTIAAAATTDTTIQMPANAIILSVSVRVTVAIPTATTFTVGDSGSAARFNTGTNVAVAANTTNAGTKAGAYYNASALAVRITPSATPANNNGRVRVTIVYFEVTPPTS